MANELRKILKNAGYDRTLINRQLTELIDLDNSSDLLGAIL